MARSYKENLNSLWKCVLGLKKSFVITECVITEILRLNVRIGLCGLELHYGTSLGTLLLFSSFQPVREYSLTSGWISAVLQPTFCLS